MEQPSTMQLARKFAATYVLLVLGLSYFAVYPSWSQGESATLLITMLWMLILAAIVAAYAVAVVVFGGDDGDPARP